MSCPTPNSLTRTRAVAGRFGRRRSFRRPVNGLHERARGRPLWLFGNGQLAASVVIALVCAVALASWYFMGGFKSRQATVIIIVLGLLLIISSAVFGCCAVVHLSRIRHIMKQERNAELAQRFAESVGNPPPSYDESAAIHLRILRIQRSRASSIISRPGFSTELSKTIVSAELTLPTSESTPLSSRAGRSVSENDGSLSLDSAEGCDQAPSVP